MNPMLHTMSGGISHTWLISLLPMDSMVLRGIRSGLYPNPFSTGSAASAVISTLFTSLVILIILWSHGFWRLLPPPGWPAPFRLPARWQSPGRFQPGFSWKGIQRRCPTGIPSSGPWHSMPELGGHDSQRPLHHDGIGWAITMQDSPHSGSYPDTGSWYSQSCPHGYEQSRYLGHQVTTVGVSME